MTNDRRPSRLPVRGSLALALTFGGLTLLMGFRSPGDPAEDLLLAFDAGDGLGTAPDSVTGPVSPSVSASPGPSASRRARRLRQA